MAFTDDDWGRAKEANAVADFVFSLLEAQLLLLDPAAKLRPDFLMDEFSIGYLFGFTDGVLQARGVEAEDTQALVALSRTFQRFFEPEAGPKLLGQALRSQDDNSAIQGKEAGIQDCSNWMSSKGKSVPLQLAQHHMG